MSQLVLIYNLIIVLISLFWFAVHLIQHSVVNLVQLKFRQLGSRH